MLKLYQDQRLRTIASLVDRVCKESKRQIDIYGVQAKFFDRWHTFLSEEVGELAKAISDEDDFGKPVSDIAIEAIHVATLALKIAEMATLDTPGVLEIPGDSDE